MERGHGGGALRGHKRPRSSTVWRLVRVNERRTKSDCESFSSGQTDRSQGNDGDAGTCRAVRDVTIMTSRTTFWDIEDRQAQYDASCPGGIVDRGEGRVPEQAAVACELTR